MAFVAVVCGPHRDRDRVSVSEERDIDVSFVVGNLSNHMNGWHFDVVLGKLFSF